MIVIDSQYLLNGTECLLSSTKNATAHFMAL